MPGIRNPAARLLAAAAFAAAPAAFAHGPADPAKHKAPAAVEQKPFGRAADSRNATRTIEISMDDRMRYRPDVVRVKRGETVRFVVANGGQAMHELVLGTPEELQRHAELMRKFPGMEHDEPHMVHVAPGGREDLVWQFNRAGEFRYACLIPGHFEAGMVGRVIVAP